MDSEQIVVSTKALTDFVMVSEYYRKKFSESLRECKAVNDICENKIFELDQTKKLFSIQFYNVESRLEMVFESVNEISNAKNLEDKYQFEIDQL
jgi:hypothetical protein